MASTWNGNFTPIDDDMWNLVADMRKQAILNNRVIPVYSKSERDGLAAASPDGVIPDGTVVLRMDQSARGAVFDVFMSGAWMAGDTGVVTSGVNVQEFPGKSALASYAFRRRGTTVTARIDLNYTGSEQVSNGVTGNITDINMLSIEQDWRPIWDTCDIAFTQPGVSQFFGRIEAGGLLVLTHCGPGGTLPSGAPLRIDGSWEVL